MKWKYIKWQLIFCPIGKLRWAVRSGYLDGKHKSSTQVRVMRRIARIIIAVDVGKAGGLFTCCLGPAISNQSEIFYCQLCSMVGRRWGCRGSGCCFIFVFGGFFGLNNRNYFWTLWRWEVQDQGAGQVGFILRPLLMACRWPPPCYMLT